MAEHREILEANSHVIATMDMHAFVLFHLSLPSPAPLTVCLSCDPWMYPPIHVYPKCASDTQIRIANIAITHNKSSFIDIDTLMHGLSTFS
jgi:hypothetical protein